MGDCINIGSISQSNVNVKSSLNIAQQVVRVSEIDTANKAELSRLLGDLSEVLATLPAEQGEDAEAVAEAASDLVSKVVSDHPNRKVVGVAADVLRKLAIGTAVAVPIISEIVDLVTKIVGIAR